MPRQRIRYGPHREQVGDLWLPGRSRPAESGWPVVVLVHGGFWRGPYRRSLLSPLAPAIVARGWAAWNIEYRRTGAFGGGGGWPTTFQDAAAAVDHLQALRSSGLDLGRVVICGHSAGGHLAFLVAGRWSGRHAGSGGVSGPRVEMSGAVALAGVLDLKAADELGLGADAALALMGGHYADMPAAYEEASPAAALPLCVPQVLVHGVADRAVPVAMSAEYSERALAAGDDVRYLELEGKGHRDLVDPQGEAWQLTLDEVGRLLAPGG